MSLKENFLWGGAPHIFKLAADPALSLITVFFIYKPAVSLQRLIRPHSKQTDRFFILMGYPVPPAELFCQILLMHAVAVSCHWIIFQVDYIFMFRHFPHPCFFLRIIPWIPEHFITAQSSSCSHRKADPVQFRLPFQPFKSTFYILRRHRILSFKILMENPDFFLRIKLFLEIQRQVQQ